MQYKYFLLVISIAFTQLAFTQSVWPGDVNNNGIVNKVDLLYLGYAFSETGASRDAIDGTWSPKMLPVAWDNSFPNGVNYLYADCNGDGLVDEQDASIVLDNIGLTHNDIPFQPDEFLQGSSGMDPACEFLSPPSAVPVDQLFNLEIGLGNIELPINNASGFSFFLNIEPAIIGLNNTQFTLNQNSWLDTDTSQIIIAQQKDTENVRLKVAYTKTDRIPLSGSGSVGTVSFVIETNVIDLLITDSVTFTIDSIIVLDEGLNPIPVVPDTLKLWIDRDLKVSNVENPLLTKIVAYPNPNRGFSLLESPDGLLEKVEIINEMGQIILTQTLQNTRLQSINYQQLPPGLYWLKLYTRKGIKTIKTQKL